MPTTVTLPEIKDHLALMAGQDQDDMLLQLKLDAAQSFIEQWLGFTLLERFIEPELVPSDLRDAILQLTAWWYENREAVMERGAPLPFGVADIIDAHRDRTF
ncbi:head-tail connector protein [Paracoccus rhizosphaerae]|uniref:Head-tail connector protein n=1 Tax=Paracoccus rhizosphaerae TaxID=1133347 RepID=A0ABV6CJX7_9RHOB|nr:head-tail connector protein [Paracoccus rhizosphaerae]